MKCFFFRTLLVFSFFLWILSSSLLWGQGQGNYFMKGYILKEDTISPLSGATIINRNSLYGTISNVQGAFMIRMKKTDTLEIACIGYQTIYLHLTDTLAAMPSFVKIYLKDKIYELNTVEVVGYRIRRRIKPQEIDLRRTDPLSIDMSKTKGSAAGFAGRNDYLLPAGFSLGEIYEALSKKGKERRKVAEMEIMDRAGRYIRQRYNRNYVQEISGLKGAQLDNFIRFCKPPDQLVLDGSDYELALFVNQCLNDFRAQD